MHQGLTQRQPQTSTIGLIEVAMFLEANKALKHLAARFSCDAEALAEVLEQLLDNSLRYSEGPAQIELQLLERDGAIGLCWRDQGLGITAEPRSQVFERFVRLEEHRDCNQADGAGLGLALSEALMQAMGGSIELEQPNVLYSKGSTFLLRWPQV